MQDSSKACTACGKTANEANLRRCARCRQVLYCSIACQRTDWNAGHKVACAPPAASPAPLPPALPPPSAWRFGEPTERPDTWLPFPFSRAAFEEKLPAFMQEVRFLYNVVLTCKGKRSAEESPAQAIFIYSARKGQQLPTPIGGTRIAGQDEIATAMRACMTLTPPESPEAMERLFNNFVQDGIDDYKAHAALFIIEMRLRDPINVSRVLFEGVAVAALCKGMRRAFLLDMTAAGRRDGSLIKVEPAIETDDVWRVPVFHSREPRFY